MLLQHYHFFEPVRKSCAFGTPVDHHSKPYEVQKGWGPGGDSLLPMFQPLHGLSAEGLLLSRD